ncbi:hypothetical protein J1614_009931 [Plenodomus biglobosus]|nr:hypothetical protein J1614_009931 [Plenodomus biglobosus]
MQLRQQQKKRKKRKKKKQQRKVTIERAAGRMAKQQTQKKVKGKTNMMKAVPNSPLSNQHLTRSAASLFVRAARGSTMPACG